MCRTIFSDDKNMENNEKKKKVSQDNLSKVNTAEQSKIVGRKEGEVLKSKGIADFQDQNGKIPVRKDRHIVANSYSQQHNQDKEQ